MKQIKQRKFEQHDDLLWKFFRHYRDNWSSYRDNGEIIWVGKHYLMIRTGMSEAKSRYVWLVDKNGLQYDEDAPALVQIAAGLHPVQAERAQHHAEMLHESNQSNGEETLLKGRWCKSRLQQCIAHAKRRDFEYEQELPRWIEDYEQREAERKALEQEERKFAARLVRFARKETQSVGTNTTGERWDNGIYGDRTMRLEGTLGSNITFCANPNDWKVRIYGREHLQLTESQFKRYVRLLCKFHAENLATGVTENDDDE